MSLHIGSKVWIRTLHRTGVVTGVGHSGSGRPSIYFVRLDTGKETAVRPANLEAL